MIETEHKGYKIRYSENEDVWRSFELDLDAVSLGALKRKIDLVERQARKAAQTPVFVARFNSTPVAATITGKAEGSAYRKGEHVWVFLPGEKRRTKVSIDEVIEDTPENRALIEKHRDFLRAADAAQRAARAALEVIPRMTQIPALPETEDVA